MTFAKSKITLLKWLIQNLTDKINHKMPVFITINGKNLIVSVAIVRIWVSWLCLNFLGQNSATLLDHNTLYDHLYLDYMGCFEVPDADVTVIIDFKFCLNLWNLWIA